MAIFCGIALSLLKGGYFPPHELNVKFWILRFGLSRCVVKIGP